MCMTSFPPSTISFCFFFSSTYRSLKIIHEKKPSEKIKNNWFYETKNKNKKGEKKREDKKLIESQEYILVLICLKT